MAVTSSKGMPLRTKAPDFSLPGVDGRTWSLDSFGDAKALVVVFTCNHCPYAKAAEDRLVAISRDYAEKGVRVVAINPNDDAAYPDDSFDAMVERAKAKGFDFPYLRDESQAVARAYDAACTPDVFVFGPDRGLFYNGRIDDDWKSPEKVKRQDLRLALDAVLEGKPLAFEPVPSMGCSIKWK
jgi:peroxiredoxin